MPHSSHASKSVLSDCNPYFSAMPPGIVAVNHVLMVLRVLLSLNGCCYPVDTCPVDGGNASFCHLCCILPRFALVRRK